MPSVFGHVLASSALGYALFSQHVHRRAVLLAGLCAVAPDADVLAFSWGIPYESIWGHRGWTHSLAFAALLGLSTGWLFYSRQRYWPRMALYFALATASHPLLDMLTTGGLGCALWWPISEERLFFPLRVIRVSPLEMGDFISKWGIKVLLSEAFWIGLPGAALVAARVFWAKPRK
ncbi:MAG: metal-dependent hydrolase [Saprospiraceae bacterium]|nr:metal-dependent hydrolase [Saprospiraceae bacterium]MDW8230800.1 metal-dependent hydrolase [Saprospiraceae bacterium]